MRRLAPHPALVTLVLLALVQGTGRALEPASPRTGGHDSLPAGDTLSLLVGNRRAPIARPDAPASTAFAGGRPFLPVRRGEHLEIPVTLDLSRVSPAGDLGSAQFELTLDPAVLRFDSVRVGVTGAAEVNHGPDGRLRFAFAGTRPQGRAHLDLLTVFVTVRSDARAERTLELPLHHTAAPTDTRLRAYPMPEISTGTVRVTPF